MAPAARMRTLRMDGTAVVKLLVTIRLRRAIKDLCAAQRLRESLDLEDPDYGGLMLDQIVREQELKRRIEGLERRLAKAPVRSPRDTSDIGRPDPQPFE